MSPRPGPPERIRSERLLIRSWQAGESDASRLRSAIVESLDHLRAWMPWAMAEPESVEAKIERMQRYERAFLEGGDFVYGIFDPEDQQVLGGCGLHERVGPGAREIGYWIHVDHVRRGYATEMAGALTRVGFDVLGLERLEIRCDPRNAASAGVPRKLAYLCRETLPGDERDPDGRPRDTAVWELDRARYGASPAAGQALQVFDASGRELPLAASPGVARAG